MAEKTKVPFTTPFKFKIGDRVKHLVNGDAYTIEGLPNKYRLESTGEPAYAYIAVNDPEQVIWCRSQSQMEDGRFVLLPEQNSST